jgi:hypothetical protein
MLLLLPQLIQCVTPTSVHHLPCRSSIVRYDTPTNSCVTQTQYWKQRHLLSVLRCTPPHEMARCERSRSPSSAAARQAAPAPSEGASQQQHNSIDLSVSNASKRNHLLQHIRSKQLARKRQLLHLSYACTADKHMYSNVSCRTPQLSVQL